ncbi:DNA-directed primase/polymerase protein-like [Schistocerca gregaria]|uniref:DNA-directed primase/polymerase protein-like n=1 Tax=Schistocerca gregaria TaxID=7010 RepID=UPI00211E050F|nr:DNA-directed primase/polymerase protein-like [Schistocerca gregaria]
MTVENSLSPATFYGKKRSRKVKAVAEIDEYVVEYRHRLADANDPSSTWKVFRKQEAALKFGNGKCGLMVFAFQHRLGRRSFLVANPKVFWHYDVQRKVQERCSYEIIPEHTVCKLYFDIEFDKLSNKTSNGPKMVETFLKIVFLYLDKELNVKVSRKNVIDMDSSTPSKFSRHLIFIIPNAAFHCNYCVGNFVKYICQEITHSVSADDHLLRQFFQLSELESLFVWERRSETVLFCDQSVYTKNRHFRVYGSTKYMKNNPLAASEEDQFKSTLKNQNELELWYFLESLVTYFSSEVGRVLDYDSDCVSFKQGKKLKRHSNYSSACNSPYPQIDNFISKVIDPGRIWRWAYFSSNGYISYDIIGYRFCHNINREHRSNNIKYIVNLAEACFYQKCHDPDCRSFTSQTWKLPPELAFILEDDEIFNTDKTEVGFGDFELPDDAMIGILDNVEFDLVYVGGTT